MAADPAGCIQFDGRAHATVSAAGHTWRAGRFEIPMVWALRDRAMRARAQGDVAEGARSRLWVLDGEGPATDIAGLQATAPAGCLFQAASQFNCLEAPGPNIVPVSEYVFDGTQGPRASVSALAGTMLRHHAAPAPDGTRFVQSDARCLDLLGDVVEPSLSLIHI